MKKILNDILIKNIYILNNKDQTVKSRSQITKSNKHSKNMKSLRESIFDTAENIVNNDTILIEKFLNDNYDITGPYAIKKGVVDVNGQVSVKNQSIESLTDGLFQFGTVRENFYCDGCKYLKSLEGSPEEVGGNFNCRECRSLKSLEGAPKEVGGDFSCTHCWDLKTLEGGPEKVGRDFNCSGCDYLTSLKGVPKEIGGDFFCCNCASIKSLKDIPGELSGNFYCTGCPNLTSLEGAPEWVGGDGGESLRRFSLALLEGSACLDC